MAWAGYLLARPSGLMILHAIYAAEAYANYLQVEPIYDIMLAAAHQTALTLYGGRAGSAFADIASEQVEVFDGLLESLSARIAELDVLIQSCGYRSSNTCKAFNLNTTRLLRWLLPR